MRKTFTSFLAAATFAMASYSPAREYAVTFPSDLDFYTNSSFSSCFNQKSISLRTNFGPLPARTYDALFQEPKSSLRGLRTAEDAHRLTARYDSQLLTLLLTYRSPETGYAAAHGILLSHDGFFLTQYHVLDAVVTGKAQGYAVYHTSQGEPCFEQVDVAASWPSCDLALGKISGKSFTQVNSLSLSMNIPSDKLPILGMYTLYPSGRTLERITPLSFPETERRSVLLPGMYLSRSSANSSTTLTMYGQPYVLRSVGAVGYPSSHLPSENHPHPAPPFISSLQTSGDAIEYLVPIVIQSTPGNSGTPIFDESGALAGMLAMGDRNYPLEGRMVSSLIIRLFLHEYQKSFEEK